MSAPLTRRPAVALAPRTPAAPVTHAHPAVTLAPRTPAAPVTHAHPAVTLAPRTPAAPVTHAHPAVAPAPVAWKVRVFLTDQKAPGAPPREVRGLDLPATIDSLADAKAAVRATYQGPRKLRSLNVSADRPKVLLAYVYDEAPPAAVPVKGS
jgi:hypothetical protein